MSDAIPFRPPAWLANAHLQSILPSFPPWSLLARWRSHDLRARAEPWIVDCGDLGRLSAQLTRARTGTGATRRTVVLLHGWEGHAGNGKVVSLGSALLGAGYDVVRLNLRDHGGTTALNRELFHSCRLDEVAEAVRRIAARCAGTELFLAGFSLGGNFLLRVAAAPELPPAVRGVVAISPVLDPARTLAAMESGSAIYHDHFMRLWARSLRRKQDDWPHEYDFAEILRTPDVRAVTRALVQRYTAFRTLEEYLAGYAITDGRLATLAVPARILLAADDPIVPVIDAARLGESPLLRVTVTTHGGHCGFLSGLATRSFAERFTLEEFGRLVS